MCLIAFYLLIRIQNPYHESFTLKSWSLIGIEYKKCKSENIKLYLLISEHIYEWF